MSLLPRRLSLQLTPLLDLLLIVIFAQYMEVQQQTVESEAEVSSRVAELNRQLDRAAADLTAARSAHLRDLEELARREREAEVIRQEKAELQQAFDSERIELTEALERTAEQRDTVGRLVGELFNIPEELVEEILKPHSRAEEVRSPEKLEQLQQKFRDLAEKQASEVVRHLLTYEELRKRCDIWELHITETGNVLMTTGEHTHTFRAETSESFSAKLFERYKALPQPKSLVIILLSYGDAQATWREAALRGIPQAADRMRADSSGRTRFEYAVLGYRAEPPHFPSQ